MEEIVRKNQENEKKFVQKQTKHLIDKDITVVIDHHVCIVDVRSNSGMGLAFGVIGRCGNHRPFVAILQQCDANACLLIIGASVLALILPSWSISLLQQNRVGSKYRISIRNPHNPPESP